MSATPNTLDYEPLVLSLVKRAGGHLPGVIDHEDLAQQARCELLDLARRWDPERSPFPAFVQGHLKWSLAHYVRHCDPNRRSATVRVDMVAIDALLNIAEAHDFQDESAVAMDCQSILEHLTPEHRSVLWMHHAEGYKLPQIAKALGITVEECQALSKRAMRAARAIVAGGWE